MTDFNVIFTDEGIRNTKPARLGGLDSELISDSYMRNTVKEELILEYVDHFRAQFVQLYPFRSPLFLSPPNEVGVPKFVCTTIRPSQPPLRELYDLPSCARFVSSYIRYEPLDPPTELPKQLPSPSTTLATRTGDCFDMAIVLASYLIGNGYDAYVVVGTAPKWITLKQSGLIRYEFIEPNDAIDRKSHTSSESLQISSSTTTAPTTIPTPNSTTDNGNKYKLPPLSVLESEFLKNRTQQEKDTNAKLSASVSYESESETSDQELHRLRDGRPKGAKNIPAYVTKHLVSSDHGSLSTETPLEDVSSTDPLHGQRIHAWVVVREGKREMDSPCFVEPSTGSIYTTKDSPYLSIESVFNHKNLWINMQAQPLIPHQELDKGSPLAPLLRNALNVKHHQQAIKGKGGMIAASAVTSTLAGTMGGEMEASVRSEMLSPYMSALSAMKQAQLIELNENVKRRARDKAAAKDTKEDKEPDPPESPLPPGQYPVGAPVLRGPAALYTMKNPRPPKPKEVPAPVVKTKAPKPVADENNGENTGEATATEGGATEGESNAAASETTNTETSETVAPSEDTTATTPDGAPEATTTTFARPSSSKPGTANSTLRPSQSRPGTRARSQGGLRPSARPWKEYLSDQTDSLNEQLADVLTTEMNQLPTVNELQWDLQNSDCWEFCFLPYEKLPDDNEIPENENSNAGTSSSNVAGESKDGDHKEETENANNDNHENSPNDPSSSKEGRTGSANVRNSAKPKKNKYANLQIELDGEHLLDLPPSWSEPLTMDAVKARQAIDASAGSTINYYKARLQRYQMHQHTEGLITRFTSYADSARILPTKVVEVFARRKDGLYKRVRYITKPNPHALYGQGTGLQIIEEHFDRGKQATGVGMIIEELGKRRDMFFYTGARIDGLLLRTEIFGKKVMEYYSPVTVNRLWYRSVTFAKDKSGKDHHHHQESKESHDHHDRLGSSGKLRKGPAGTVNGVLSIEVDHKLEVPLRKMAEKYRRDPSKPAYADPNKIVYSMEDNTVTIKYHTATGKIAHATRSYAKPHGEMHMITTDPLAAPLRPYDAEQDYRYFVNLEKDCHTAARTQAKMGIELFQMRAWEVTHPELERTVFDIASDRALSGAPIQEETERKDDNLTKAPDYLLPFLLAAKASDPTNPDEKSARKADRDARAAYKERLLERIAIIKRREDDETEKLHRRQQAFSRAREHTEAAEKEFEQFVSAAEFRISILQQRIERQQLLFDVKLREMDDRLRKDPRLLVIYDPVAWRERQQELGLAIPQ